MTTRHVGGYWVRLQGSFFANTATCFAGEANLRNRFAVCVREGSEDCGSMSRCIEIVELPGCISGTSRAPQVVLGTFGRLKLEVLGIQ